MSIVFVAAANQVAAAFVPAKIKDASLTYVRISAFQALSSTIEAAVAYSTRALDQPDVPLVISSIKFLVNILLDMILISRFHISGVTPTVNTQATTQLVCNMVASVAGLIYFLVITHRQRRRMRVSERSMESVKPTLAGLKALARPGAFTFTESAIRNALYLACKWHRSARLRLCNRFGRIQHHTMG